MFAKYLFIIYCLLIVINYFCCWLFNILQDYLLEEEFQDKLSNGEAKGMKDKAVPTCPTLTVFFLFLLQQCNKTFSSTEGTKI